MDEKDKQLIEKLTKAVNQVYENPRKLFFRQFLLGLFSGLGATLGVTIVVALLGLILRWLGGLPVVGDWIIGVSNTLNQ